MSTVNNNLPTDKVDNITPFNGVCIKLSGSGCLLNITGDKTTGYKAILGLVNSPTMNVKKYNLDGKPVEAYSLVIDSQNKFLNSTNNITVKTNNLINPTAASRLLAFSYMPNLSELYFELGPNEEIYVDWSKIPYKISFDIEGEFCTYNLGVCPGDPTELAGITFYNESNPSFPYLDFGNVGKNVGCTIEFSPSNQEMIYLNLDSQQIISSYDNNLYTVIEIESCLSNLTNDPFNYYYDNQIIEYIYKDGVTKPIKLGIHGKIIGCVSRYTTDKVYCSPVVLSGNQP